MAGILVALFYICCCAFCWVCQARYNSYLTVHPGSAALFIVKIVVTFVITAVPTAVTKTEPLGANERARVVDLEPWPARVPRVV